MEASGKARERVDFDVITIGGGLAGASLARAMAQAGRRVLVLERETRFRDRVRGEQLASWGSGEARVLGLYDLLTARCAHSLRWIAQYRGSEQISRRDLVATTPAGLPNLSFCHPTMQEVVLEAAAEEGAEVRRGASVRRVELGRPGRDALLESDDWDAAGHAYAKAHDRHFQTVHRTEDWFTELFLLPGPQAEARRARVLPLFAQDGSRLPDTFQSGPDAVTTDENARRRMFGEAA